MNKRDSAVVSGLSTHLGALMPKHADEEDEAKSDEHRAIINFSTTSYAVLERDQRVDVKIQRRGPVDVDVRFRCLNTFLSCCMWIICSIYTFSTKQCSAAAFDLERLTNCFEQLTVAASLIHLDLRTSDKTSIAGWTSFSRAPSGRSKGHAVANRHQ